MIYATLAPDYVRAIAPYQPGKPVSELAREMGLDEANIVKLASNENPLGLPASAREALQAAVSELARYPDGNGFELKAKIAEKFDVEMHQIILGNGSNDVLELVARAFLTTQDAAVFSQYAFAVYPLVTQAVGARGIEVPASEYGHDLDAMLAAIDAQTKLVFIANPNNPTGTYLETAQVERFLEAVPKNVLVVLDEAYTEYLPATSRPDVTAWLRQYPNLIISRTLSKAYGLAGLRVGFALCNPEVADLINRVRQPFNVNSLAQAAAIAALDDQAFLAESLRVNDEGMKQIVDALVELGLDYIPSSGNFVTFHCADAAVVNLFLLKNGVIVRPLGGYGMKNSLRVSIGLPHENARFIEVLKQAPGLRSL